MSQAILKLLINVWFSLHYPLTYNERTRKYGKDYEEYKNDFYFPSITSRILEGVKYSWGWHAGGCEGNIGGGIHLYSDKIEAGLFSTGSARRSNELTRRKQRRSLSNRPQDKGSPFILLPPFHHPPSGGHEAEEQKGPPYANYCLLERISKDIRGVLCPG